MGVLTVACRLKPPMAPPTLPPHAMGDGSKAGALHKPVGSEDMMPFGKRAISHFAIAEVQKMPLSTRSKPDRDVQHHPGPIHAPMLVLFPLPCLINTGRIPASDYVHRQAQYNTWGHLAKPSR